MKTVLLAYIPVLHQGYKKLFESHPEVNNLFILGKDILLEFPHIAKDIRQLDENLVKQAIESWKIFESVTILNKEDLLNLSKTQQRIIAPNEEVIKFLMNNYLPKVEVIYSPIFLRWDKHNTVAEYEVSPDIRMSESDFDRKMMSLAQEEGENSSDIWRQIGSLIIKNNEIICKTHNKGVPSEHTPMYEGDPRNNFHKGMNLELSLFLHSEAGAIAEMARKGISTLNAEMYVTIFPCPPCAKLIAAAGIKKLFYKNGYGILDGERVLREGGVEMIKVI